jgi:hypothetical protein
MNEKPGLEPGFFSLDELLAPPQQKYRKQPHAK